MKKYLIFILTIFIYFGCSENKNSSFNPVRPVSSLQMFVKEGVFDSTNTVDFCTASRNNAVKHDLWAIKVDYTEPGAVYYKNCYSLLDTVSLEPWWESKYSSVDSIPWSPVGVFWAENRVVIVTSRFRQGDVYKVVYYK